MIYDGLMMLLVFVFWSTMYYYMAEGLKKFGNLIKRMVRYAHYKMESQR